MWQREKGPLCRVVVATWPDGAERREATSRRVPINAFSSVERGPSGSVGRLEAVAVPVGRQPGGMVHDTVDDGRGGGRIQEHLGQRANGRLVVTTRLPRS